MAQILDIVAIQMIEVALRSLPGEQINIAYMGRG